MTIRTLFKYLVGNRAAILQIANTPAAVWLGALFVLAAGFAREYDARDLLHEPWYLVVPLGASLGTSFILYCLTYLASRRRSDVVRPFWSTYRRFLSLYWMTAPLALLYAFPADRLLSVEAATATNLGLLALVSVWRVSLMIRVVRVFFGSSVEAAVAIVMLFADSVALVVLFFTRLPIFNIMGGIPLSARDEMISGAAMFVGCLGLPLWFVWFFGVLFTVAGKTPWEPPANEPVAHGHVSPTLWGLAAIMILGWGIVLPYTQPQQQLRHNVEIALLNGRVAEGVETMSKHVQEDFPPYWDPPPWGGYYDTQQLLLEVLELAVRDDVPRWVQAIYVNKLEAQMSRYSRFVGMKWQELTADDRERYLRVFERAHIADQNPETFEEIIQWEDDPHRKERIEKLRDAARAAGVSIGADDY